MNYKPAAGISPHFRVSGEHIHRNPKELFDKSGMYYFCQEFDQAEIDQLIEQDGVLYPVEMKKSTAPRAERRKAFLQTGKV